MLFSLIFEYPPMRAKYSYNVVSRHSQSICRQTLVSPLLFLQITILCPSLTLPLFFYPFWSLRFLSPRFYRLRALVLRDVLLSIHMTDAAVISFLFLPNFFPFSVGRYHIFTAPRRT